MARVSLKSGGQAFESFESVTVTRSIEAIASSFSVSYVDASEDPVPLACGDGVDVYLQDQLVLTGWIDQLQLNRGARDSSASASGRDVCGDLVDCSAVHATGHWKDATFETIAKDLLKPFGIRLLAFGLDAKARKPVRHHGIEPGETVAECLGRLARKLGILLRGGPGRALTAGRVAAEPKRGAIIRAEGGNIQDGGKTTDYRDRFSQYLARGQSQGNAKWYGKAIRQGEGVATDERVRRYRPEVFQVDGHATAEEMQRAAEWRRGTRAAQSERIWYLVDRWTWGRGKLWEPGEVYQVSDRQLRIPTRSLLLAEVSFVLDPTGAESARLGLMPPEGWRDLDPPTKGGERW